MTSRPTAGRTATGGPPGPAPPAGSGSCHLPAAELRALPKGTALLLATGTRPALLSLLPWYDGPRAGAVASEVQTATAGISRRDATARVR